MGSGTSAGTLEKEGGDRARRPKRGKDRDIQQDQGPENDRDQPGRLNIAKLLRLDKTENLTIEWNGYPVNLRVKPQLVHTPIVRQHIADSLNGRPLGIAEALALLIDDWDIDLAGDPFPPTVENLGICPKDFLELVAEKILMEPRAQAANG